MEPALKDSHGRRICWQKTKSWKWHSVRNANQTILGGGNFLSSHPPISYQCLPLAKPGKKPRQGILGNVVSRTESSNNHRHNYTGNQNKFLQIGRIRITWFVFSFPKTASWNRKSNLMVRDCESFANHEFLNLCKCKSVYQASLTKGLQCAMGVGCWELARGEAGAYI